MGPRVLPTARAILSTPAARRSRASASKAICLAICASPPGVSLLESAPRVRVDGGLSPPLANAGPNGDEPLDVHKPLSSIDLCCYRWACTGSAASLAEPSRGSSARVCHIGVDRPAGRGTPVRVRAAGRHHAARRLRRGGRLGGHRPGGRRGASAGPGGRPAHLGRAGPGRHHRRHRGRPAPRAARGLALLRPPDGPAGGGRQLRRRVRPGPAPPPSRSPSRSWTASCPASTAPWTASPPWAATRSTTASGCAATAAASTPSPAWWTGSAPVRSCSRGPWV